MGSFRSPRLMRLHHGSTHPPYCDTRAIRAQAISISMFTETASEAVLPGIDRESEPAAA